MLVQDLFRARCFRRIRWTCGTDATALRVLHDTHRRGTQYPTLHRPLQKRLSGTITQDYHCIVANSNTGEIILIFYRYKERWLLAAHSPRCLDYFKTERVPLVLDCII